MQIFQIPITQLKSPNQNGIKICTTVHCTYNSYKVSLNFAQGFGINISMEIFQSPITPLKIIEPESTNTKHIYQSYKDSWNSDQGFWRNTVNKMFNGNILQSHNSAKNPRTRTGLRYAQQGLVLIIPTRFYWISTKGFG